MLNLIKIDKFQRFLINNLLYVIKHKEKFHNNGKEIVKKTN